MHAGHQFILVRREAGGEEFGDVLARNGEAVVPGQNRHPAQRFEPRIGEFGISPADEPVPEAANAAGGADRPQPVNARQADHRPFERREVALCGFEPAAGAGAIGCGLRLRSLPDRPCFSPSFRRASAIVRRSESAARAALLGAQRSCSAKRQASTRFAIGSLRKYWRVSGPRGQEIVFSTSPLLPSGQKRCRNMTPIFLYRSV